MKTTKSTQVKTLSTVVIPKSTHSKLKKFAKKNQTTMQLIVNKALKAVLKN